MITTTRLRAEVERLVGSVGGSVVWTEEITDYTWDGRALYARPVRHDIIQYGLHEVGHVLVCAQRSKRRLRLPEYGLGSDPSNGSDAKEVIGYDRAMREESLACSLHVALAAYYCGAHAGLAAADYVNVSTMPTRRGLTFMQKRHPQLPGDFAEKTWRKIKRAKKLIAGGS